MASPQTPATLQAAERTRRLSPETRTNPKRCAANQSVSLRHNSPPLQTSHHEKPPAQAAPPAGPQFTSQPRAAEHSQQGPQTRLPTLPTRSRSPLAQNGRQQSGSAVPSAWFNQSNTNVQPSSQNRTTFIDSEPPFFLSHLYPSSGSDVGMDDSPPQGAFQRVDSENDDLRTIIDDLTVENKELKQRLKKFERHNPMNSESERLLEVRMHGLSADRKRDLEALLRKFVTTIHASPDQNQSRKNKVGYGPLSKGHSSNSMTNSNNRTTDSGYQSMSASNPSNGSNPNITAPLPQHNKNKNVKSYLNHLPTIQHPPKDMASLPEKTRMKLVVRRLEDLFTGSPLGQPIDEKADHTQARQQQQVSEDAATADRKTAAAIGHRGPGEGSREARMMPPGVAAGPHKAKKSNDSPDSMDTSSGDATPDQRPTRPLDLDVSRSHNAAETMDYIRHLGFGNDKPEATPSQSGDWVWLNLLISMAQLHTMNVTPEFIRKSVSELSDKFELSSDGRKLRWTGGVEGTKLSSGSEGDSSVYGVSGSSPEEEHTSENVSGESGRSKRRKLDVDYEMTGVEPTSVQVQRIADEQGGDPPNDAWPRPSNLAGSKSLKGPAGPFLPYRPIFHGLDKLRQKSGSASTSSDSGSYSGTKQHKSSGDGVSPSSDDSAGVGDGPVIFYRNPFFCRDLSADRRGVKRALDNSAAVSARDENQVLGLVPSSLRSGDSCSRSSDFESLASECESSLASSLEEDAHESLPVPDLKVATLEGHNDANAQPTFVDFEASGLGGVMPKDNFGIRVTVRRAPVKNGEPVMTGRYRIRTASFVPPQLSRFQSTVLSEDYATLKASELPAPSFIVLSSSSGEFDDESDEEMSDDGSSSSGSEVQSPPAPASFLKEFSSLEESVESSLEATSSDETGSSFNFRSGPGNDISVLSAPMRRQSLRSPSAESSMKVDADGDESDDESEESSSIDSTASVASSSSEE